MPKKVIGEPIILTPWKKKKPRPEPPRLGSKFLDKKN